MNLLPTLGYRDRHIKIASDFHVLLKATDGEIERGICPVPAVPERGRVE